MVQIITRLHLPDARPGTILDVDPERAEKLVNARYAVYAGEIPEKIVEPEPVAEDEPMAYLPSPSDYKVAWVETAEALGIAVVREDGTDKTKAELIEEVTEAVSP